MINSQARTREEGVDCVTVAGVDHCRPRGTAEATRRGDEPARISPGSDDPGTARHHSVGDGFPDP
jgi:hypothetical protein